MPTFATRYKDADRDRSKIFATTNTEPSMTQQSDRNDTDINIIAARYLKTGQMPQITNLPALSGDFSGITDYRTALDYINNVREEFQELPAKIRERFDNDPAKFLDFAENPKNEKEMQELGLLPKPAITPPVIKPEEKKPDEKPIP